jgi:hypothetical protein
MSDTVLVILALVLSTTALLVAILNLLLALVAGKRMK